MTTDLWNQTLAQLKLETAPAAFNQWLAGTTAESRNGTLTVYAAGDTARQWLDLRMRGQIERVIAGLADPAPAVVFVVGESESMVEAKTAPDSPGQRIAQSDFDSAWRKGFSIVGHYASYFWQPYLGPAFALWKRLDADNRIPTDRRNIREVVNRWSPPLRYYYRQLARDLGKEHPRYIKGGEVECWQSMSNRQAGEIISTCCGNPDFQPVRVAADQNGCARCLHWRHGLLQILHQEKLVAIDEQRGRRWSNQLQIQVWRLFPVLTPYQIGQMNEQLAEEHERWLTGRSDRPPLGEWLGISLREWEQIEEKTLVDLMDGYINCRELDGEFQPDKQFLLHACNKIPGESFF